jgi:hypothetical protein
MAKDLADREILEIEPAARMGWRRLCHFEPLWRGLLIGRLP